VPHEDLVALGFDAGEARTLKTRKGRGCGHCNGTGYKGRVGLFEVLEMTDPLRDIILGGGTTLDIRNRARREGMTTLREVGMNKVREGVTTAAEVKRETVA
jgi:type IV pilus assembly protein PilB